MALYCVTKNAEADGLHEVHVDSCTYLPHPTARIFLGNFQSCRDAVQAAMKHFPKSHGCYYCATPCHTRPAVLRDGPAGDASRGDRIS